MMRPPPPPPPDDDDDTTIMERIAGWEKIVAQTVAGYRLTLDDWLNDMDLRQAIEETLPILPLATRNAARQRLQTLDATFEHATEPTAKCLWGSRTARQEKWTAKRQWWYFRKPLRAAPQLLAEIAAVR